MARRQGFTRGARRKTQWAGMGDPAAAANLNTFVAVGAAANVILSQGFIIGGGAGVVDEQTTITRTIGMLGARIAAETAAASAQFAIGCAVFTAAAVAAGAASLPNPVTTPDFEWLYFLSAALDRGAVANDDAGGVATLMMPIDVKSQRIVNATETIVWVARSDVANVELAINGRYLVKLT